MPRILILSDSCISPAHGTGAAVIRIFEEYPVQKLFNVFTNKRGTPRFSSIQAFGTPVSGGYTPEIAERVRSFNPEIIYSVGCGYKLLRLVDELVGDNGLDIPFVQHFVDLIPGAPWADYEPLLKKNSPKMTQIWSLTQYASDKISHLLERNVRVYPFFATNRLSQTVLEGEKMESGRHRVVLVGNAWNTSVFAALVDAWNKLLQAGAPVFPIEWYVHSEGVQRVRNARIAFEPSVAWKGCLEHEEIHDAIKSASAGIIPFNTGRDPFAAGTWEYDYVQGSLPSRLVDYCTSGLPVILAGTLDTETGKYIRQHEIGVVSDPVGKESFRLSVEALLSNDTARLEMRGRSRRLAESEFEQKDYFTRLMNAFDECMAEHVRNNSGRGSRDA